MSFDMRSNASLVYNYTLLVIYCFKDKYPRFLLVAIRMVGCLVVYCFPE
jgi:hypothetical protein